MSLVCLSLMAAIYDGSSTLSDKAQAFRPQIKPSKMDIAFKQVSDWHITECFPLYHLHFHEIVFIFTLY